MAKTLKPWIKIVEIIILLFIAIVLFTYANTIYLNAIDEAKQPVDFLYHWLPTRMWINGEIENIYSEEVNHAINIHLFGRIVEGGEKYGFFAYPFPGILLFLPFALITNYEIALPFFMAFLQLSNIAILLLTIKTLSLSFNKLDTLALFLFTILGAGFILSFAHANPASSIVLSICLSLYLLQKEQLVLSGIVLSFTTIKPQLSIFLICIILARAVKFKQWKLIVSFIGASLLLYGGSFIFLPQWFSGFLNQILWYHTNSAGNSPLNILCCFGDSAAVFLTILFTVITLLVIFISSKDLFSTDFRKFYLALGLIFMCIPLTGLPSYKYNLIINLPALVLSFYYLENFFELRRSVQYGIFLAFFLLEWVISYATYAISDHYFHIENAELFILSLLPLAILLTIKKRIHTSS